MGLQLASVLRSVKGFFRSSKIVVFPELQESGGDDRVIEDSSEGCTYGIEFFVEDEVWARI